MVKYASFDGDGRWHCRLGEALRVDDPQGGRWIVAERQYPGLAPQVKTVAAMSYNETACVAITLDPKIQPWFTSSNFHEILDQLEQELNQPRG